MDIGRPSLDQLSIFLAVIEEGSFNGAARRLAACATKAARRNSRCIDKLERSAIDLGAPGRDDIYGYGLIR